MAETRDLENTLPSIIQGGMGAAVSNWSLARAVATAGEMGVVSGTALDTVLIRRLQDGDPGGHMRRAMEAFPNQNLVQPILEKWYQPEGRPPGEPYRLRPMPTVEMRDGEAALLIVACFVEVFLAKEGHEGWVGLNLLEKIQLPTLPSLFGAMLAGVDVVIMGGGIPLGIPAVLDALANLSETELKINLAGGTGSGDEVRMRFNPRDFLPEHDAPLKRPLFLPVISSHVLAMTFVRKAGGRVDGFIVEHNCAGGHNAPPRRGDAYGPSDECDLEKVGALGLPFWLAGNRATPEGLREARELGAHGVQVGTAFACAEESGITTEIKAELMDRYIGGTLEVETDFRASPTGYPLKRVDLASAPEAGPCEKCDLGYLRHVYRQEDGRIGYRCPAASPEMYVRKGGDPADCEGKRCLCNGLLSTIGLGQIKNGETVPPLLTWGEHMPFLDRMLEGGRRSFKARDLIDYLREGLAEPVEMTA